MKRITILELLALFPMVQKSIEQRLARDDVDDMIVVECEGRRTACIYGAPYMFKTWEQAEDKTIEISMKTYTPVAYYEKPLKRDAELHKRLSSYPECRLLLEA